MSFFAFLVTCLLGPLQALVLFFAPHTSAVSPRLHGSRSASPSPSAKATNGLGLQGLASDTQHARVTYPTRSVLVSAQPIHRVRVVRNIDTNLPADRAGRMVVSGRFADVCAELDRLAAIDLRAVA
jgi:uncharacterized protein YfaP (DUF2135 family)